MMKCISPALFLLSLSLCPLIAAQGLPGRLPGTLPGKQPPAAPQPAASPSPAPGQGMPAVCCDITAIDKASRVVSARELASGRIVQFKVGNLALLQKLQVGQAVHANFGTMQVSVDGKTMCCAITSVAAPPAIASKTPAQSLPPGQKAPQSPQAQQPPKTAAADPAKTMGAPQGLPGQRLPGQPPAGAPAQPTTAQIPLPSRAPPAEPRKTPGPLAQGPVGRQAPDKTPGTPSQPMGMGPGRTGSPGPAGAAGPPPRTPPSGSDPGILVTKGFVQNRRSPRQFVPHHLDELKTLSPKQLRMLGLTPGTVITPETMITIPGLRPRPGERLSPTVRAQMAPMQIPAGRYIEQLNVAERQLNEAGYSLRGPELAETDPKKMLVIVRPAIQRSKLDAQRAGLKGKQLRTGVSGAPPAGLNVGAAATMQLAEGVTHCKYVNQTWNLDDMGDPDSMAVIITGRHLVSGCKPGQEIRAGARVRGEGKTEIWLLGNPLELIGMRGDFKAPAIDPNQPTTTPSKPTATLELRVLGVKYQPYNEKITDKVEYKLPLKTITYEFPKIRFSLGPVPMSLLFGINGKLGYVATATLSPGHVVASYGPEVNVNAYVEYSAVDLGIARVGPGGEVLLVQDTISLNSDANVRFTDSKWHFDRSLSVTNEIRTLDGSLYVKACVLYWDGDRCWRHNFWEFDGFSATEDLYRDPMASIVL